MLVKPKDGLSVRCPVRGEALPHSGAEVPDNTFWKRRLRDGDVTLVEAKKPKMRAGNNDCSIYAYS